MIFYSVVVPIFNEEGAIAPLARELDRVMRLLGKPFEIIWVDDGSEDGTAGELLAVPSGATIVRLFPRMGQSAALQAGFDRAAGEVIITLDGDGQNDPEDIPLLLDRLGRGGDVVCGWRRDRNDPLSKKIASRLGNFARKLLTGEKIQDVGCTLRVFKRPVLDKVLLSGGLHRFFTALASRRGFELAEVPVRHRPRTTGVSKYGFWDRLLEGSADLLRVLFASPESLLAASRNYRVERIIKI